MDFIVICIKLLHFIVYYFYLLKKMIYDLIKLEIDYEK